VIRGLVPPEKEDDTSVSRYVFVGQIPEAVPLDLQADILAELENYENIRFVDDRAEAVDDDPPHVVKNEGVYLEFRDVPETGRRRTVDVLRYVDEDHQEEMQVTVEDTSGTWAVTGAERRGASIRRPPEPGPVRSVQTVRSTAPTPVEV
jgi:hypothetical protein